MILHSDGDINPIFPWLCQSGIDALNPIQPDALDFQDVLKKVGHHFALTGAYDLRYFLERFSPQLESKLRLSTEYLFDSIDSYNQNKSIEKKSNFCIGPTHQVQPGSDPQTFEAWIRIVHELNQKKIHNSQV